jgi:prepilin peptidase dependent protein B
MQRTKMKKQSGYSLIEILIAFLIGLIIVAAIITLYANTIRGSSDTLRSARLNHDLDSAMALMVNDIRRAGYWGGAIAGSDTDSRDNPFTNMENLPPKIRANIQIHGGSCILYTYDANGSGKNTLEDLTDDVDSNEYYGFKLEGTNIRMRKSGATTAADGCLSSDPNEWETMNIDSGNSRSEKVEIDSLTFDFDDAGAPSKCKNVTTEAVPNFENASCDAITALALNPGDTVVETRQVTITLSGHMTGEADVNKTLTSSVKVRNDRIFCQAPCP